MYLPSRALSFISGIAVAAGINLLTASTGLAFGKVDSALLIALGAGITYIAGLGERADTYALSHLVRAPSLTPSEFRAAHVSEMAALRPQMIRGLVFVVLVAVLFVGLIGYRTYANEYYSVGERTTIQESPRTSE